MHRHLTTATQCPSLWGDNYRELWTTPVELPLTGLIPALEEKLASELLIGMTLLAPDNATSVMAEEPLPMPA